jgi:hypothetical protein
MTSLKIYITQLLLGKAPDKVEPEIQKVLKFLQLQLKLQYEKDILQVDNSLKKIVIKSPLTLADNLLNFMALNYLDQI